MKNPKNLILLLETFKIYRLSSWLNVFWSENYAKFSIKISNVAWSNQVTKLKSENSLMEKLNFI